MKDIAQRPILEGFSELEVLWYEKWGSYGVKIVQGEYCVSNQDIVMTTVLGSCISVCIFDLTVGYGGMNHFMLPRLSVEGDSNSPLRYGLFSMEELINALLKKGCSKNNLQVKIAGGGKMLNSLIDVGLLNIEFIEKYLKDEQLAVKSSDLGGNQARKLVFYPRSGRLLIHKIPRISAKNIIATELESSQLQKTKLKRNEVELF